MVKGASSPTGEAEIWTATAPRVLAAAAVRSRLVDPHSEQQLSVIAMEGVDGVGASSAGSSVSGPPTLELTTTKSTSLVFALGDGGSAGGMTFPLGWVQMDKWTSGPGTGASWTQFSNQPTGAAGTAVTVKSGERTTSPWNMVAVELVNDGG